MSDYDQLILNHYQKVAKHNQLSASCSMEDQFIRESETQFILREIELFCKSRKNKKIKILDAGCGNGYLLSKIFEKFSTAELWGIEYTPELYQLALKRNLAGVQIIHGDIRIENFIKEKFDLIITERVVINILDRKDQYQTLKNILNHLKAKGIYLMIESFREPLKELNLARQEVCLEQIKESYQNKYLTEEMLDKINKNQWQEKEGVMPKNYLSSYFYLTRVFHKLLRPTGGKVKFSRMVNFFEQALPSAVGNFSPILFRKFIKKRIS